MSIGERQNSEGTYYHVMKLIVEGLGHFQPEEKKDNGRQAYAVFKNVKDCHMEKGLNLSLWFQNDRIGLTSRDYKNVGFDSKDKKLVFC